MSNSSIFPKNFLKTDARISAPKKVLVLIWEDVVTRLDFDEQNRQELMQPEVFTLFHHKIHMQNLCDKYPKWNEINADAINHVDRNNDDEIFLKSQEVSRKLCNIVFGFVPDHMLEVSQEMSEPIALAAGDYFADLLGTAESVESYINALNITHVLVVSSQIAPVRGFMELLQARGVSAKLSVSRLVHGETGYVSKTRYMAKPKHTVKPRYNTKPSFYTKQKLYDLKQTTGQIFSSGSSAFHFKRLLVLSGRFVFGLPRYLYKKGIAYIVYIIAYIAYVIARTADIFVRRITFIGRISFPYRFNNCEHYNMNAVTSAPFRKPIFSSSYFHLDFEKCICDIAKDISTEDVFVYFSPNDPYYGQCIAEIVRYGEKTSFGLFSTNQQFLNEWSERFHSHVAFSDSKVKMHALPPQVSRFSFSEFDEFLRRLEQFILDDQSSIEGLDDKNFPIPAIKSGLNYFLVRYIAATSFYYLFDELFKRKKVRSVLVSPSRNMPARALTYAARKHGIATFDLPVGTIASSHRVWAPESDHVFLADKSGVELMQSLHGFDKKSSLLVGSPRIDASVRHIREMGDQDVQDGTVFLALQHLKFSLNESLILACVEAMQDTGMHKLTIGVHPREIEINLNKYKAMCADFDLDVSVSHENNLLALAKHQICVTFFSFIAYEAFALGLEVIALNLSGREWPMRLSEAGIAKEADSVTELTELFKKIQKGTSVGSSETELNVLRDGNSVQRIVNYLNCNN